MAWFKPFSWRNQSVNIAVIQPAETSGGRVETKTLEEKVAMADYYLRAADLHLKRVIALADTEWKVSIAFWAALLASGFSFITYTARSQPPMVEYIAHSDFLILIPYLLTAYVFVFGFSVNQAESIVEERTKYRYCQHLAAQAVGATSTSAVDIERISPIVVNNKVWAYKLLSTFLFVSGIWGAAQWLAHGKLVSDGKVSAGAEGWWCAFLECSAPNPFTSSSAPNPFTSGGFFWIEWGSLLWFVAFVTTLRLFVRAYGGTR